VLHDYDWLRAALDLEQLRAHPARSIWRYATLLPLRPETLARGEGAGPL
jgi:hypothetical protein